MMKRTKHLCIILFGKLEELPNYFVDVDVDLGSNHHLYPESSQVLTEDQAVIM
jgi:hypothetical protein